MILQTPHSSVIQIHIPRTGGRYIVHLLLENGYRIQGKYHWLDVVDGVEVIHFHAKLIKKHYPKLPSFAVVRDPVDRFKSGFPGLHDFAIGIGKEKQLFSSEAGEVLKAAQKLTSNWYRPQHEFILPKTYVWQYEKGLGKEFRNWLNTDVGLMVHNAEVRYSLSEFDIKREYTYPKEMISAVERFYRRDYQLINKYSHPLQL